MFDNGELVIVFCGDFGVILCFVVGKKNFDFFLEVEVFDNLFL